MSQSSPSFMPLAFEESLVRIISAENGEPCFVAKDVALALGYEWNGSARIAHVPAEWRGVTSVVTPSGVQEVLTLTEQGLYFFLGRSDKPKALPFQKWLAGEVLPALRKTGSYGMPTSKPAIDLKAIASLPASTKKAVLVTATRELGALSRTHKDMAQEFAQQLLTLTTAFSHEKLVSEEPEAARLFWQLWPALSKSHKLNHSRNADLIALRLPETAAAHAEGLPFTLTELRAVLPHSRSYRCLGAGRAVNSVHLGKTVRCMVFYTPAPRLQQEVLA